MGVKSVVALGGDGEWLGEIRGILDRFNALYWLGWGYTYVYICVNSHDYKI